MPCGLLAFPRWIRRDGSNATLRHPSRMLNVVRTGESIPSRLCDGGGGSHAVRRGGAQSLQRRRRGGSRDALPGLRGTHGGRPARGGGCGLLGHGRAASAGRLPAMTEAADKTGHGRHRPSTSGGRSRRRRCQWLRPPANGSPSTSPPLQTPLPKSEGGSYAPTKGAARSRVSSWEYQRDIYARAGATCPASIRSPPPRFGRLPGGESVRGRLPRCHARTPKLFTS